MTPSAEPRRCVEYEGRPRIRLLIGLLRLIILAVALTSLASPAPSSALEPPQALQARPEVWVESDRVKLLSLFEESRLPADWKSLLSGIDLGEAPALGTSKFIGSAALRSYLEQLMTSRGVDPARIRIELPPDQVTVRRKAHRISTQEIEDIYRSHILSSSPWRPEDLVIEGITPSDAVELPAGAIDHVVETSPRERYLGNVVLTLHFHVDGRKIRSIRVSGKVQLFQEVIVAARPLERGEILTDGDVQLQRIQIGDNLQRYVSSAEQAMGRRVLRDAALQQPLFLTDLDAPLVLRKGSQVTILFERPGLRISAKGQAREDGGIGKSIRVLNMQTNRTVLSEVVDASTVRAIH